MTRPPLQTTQVPGVPTPGADPPDAAELWAAMIRWMLFGVGLALLPIAWNGISSLARGGDASFTTVLGNGELLLIAAVLGATTAGDLVGIQTKRFGVVRSTLLGLNFVCIMLATLLFGDFAATARSGDYQLDQAVVTRFSVLLFLVSLVVSASSHFVAKLVTR
jgi:hypothetical protein